MLPVVIYDDVTGAIGGTPLVRLRRIVAPAMAEVLLKLESMEPGGSIKDRAALAMITHAERTGALRPGGAVVEGSGGNTGVGLALVCAARGYRCTIVVPKDTSIDKVRVLHAFGAEVVLVEGDYVAAAATIAKQTGAMMPDQFENPKNPACHVESTGPEILDATRGALDAVVACIGSGGTLAGLTTFFAERAPAVEVVAACPARASSVIEGVMDEDVEAPVHGVTPGSIVRVEDKDAIATTLRLAREEGILAGGSTGVAVHAALGVAKRLGAGKRVVVVAADTGRNYLSTYFDEAWRAARGL